MHDILYGKVPCLSKEMNFREKNTLKISKITDKYRDIITLEECGRQTVATRSTFGKAPKSEGLLNSRITLKFEIFLD